MREVKKRLVVLILVDWAVVDVEVCGCSAAERCKLSMRRDIIVTDILGQRAVGLALACGTH